MKALTICQPYAHLICLPDDDDRAKRIENRTWYSGFVGPLLIHAGKSRKYLSGDNYGIPVSEMEFGKIIGVCDVRGGFPCSIINGRAEPPEWAARRWPWACAHQHTEGPWCWVLSECRKFAEPIEWLGGLRLIEVPGDIVRDQLELR